MNASQSMLALYQQSLVLSNECLQLAKKAEWDKLIEFSHRYVTTIEKLAQLTSSEAIDLTAEEQQKTKVLLQQILSNESGVKALLQSRMSELSGLINVASQQQTVNTAYNKFSDRKSFLAGHIDPEDAK